MENTSCGENCSFVKSGFCSKDCECPFFVQSWWQKTGEESPKLISDCFPKRMMMEQNNTTNRLLNLQSSEEQLRNRIARLENMFQNFMLHTENILLSIDSKKQSCDTLKEDFKQINLRENDEST